MEFLPGVPYVHTSPRSRSSRTCTGYVPSPAALEPFALVYDRRELE